MLNMNEREFVEILESFYKSKTQNEKLFRIGNVSSTYTSGLPRVLLDGDDGVGDVVYPHLFSYAPSANDRVLLIRFGTTYLILGKINNDGSPSGGGGVGGTTIDWGNVTGKPSTFTPSAHTHSWLDVTGKPTTFTPTAHTHLITDVDGLQTALDGKASSTHTHSWASITSKPTTFTPEAHTHLWADITDKPSTFAPSTHSHAIADVTGLQTALDGKSSTSHTHSNATTSVAGFMSTADKTKLDGVATNANNYSHPTGDGNLHVPATSTTNNLRVLKAGSTAGSLSWAFVDWAEVTGKPTTFTPSVHTHVIADITNFPSQTGNSGKVLSTDGNNLSWVTPSSGGGTITWNDVTGKPTTFTPSAHTHVIADITGLQTALDGKSATTHTHANATTSVAGFMSTADKTKLDGIATGANNYAHPTGDGNLHVPATSTTNNGRFLKAGATAGSLSWALIDWADVQNKPTTFTPTAHSHAISDVTGLQTALDGKSATSHTHDWASITSKPTTFTPSTHTHAISDVTGLQTALDGKATLGSAINGVLTHDAGYMYIKRFNNTATHSGFGQMVRLYYSGGTSTNQLLFQVVKNDNSITYAKLVALSFDLSSAEESKKDIVELEDGALQKILDAKAYRYRFTDADDGRDRIGLVIGRETPEEVVNRDSKTVDIYGFTTLLMKAVQEQQQQIDELRRRLDEMEGGDER